MDASSDGGCCGLPAGAAALLGATADTDGHTPADGVEAAVVERLIEGHGSELGVTRSDAAAGAEATEVREGGGVPMIVNCAVCEGGALAAVDTDAGVVSEPLAGTDAVTDGTPLAPPLVVGDAGAVLGAAETEAGAVSCNDAAADGDAAMEPNTVTAGDCDRTPSAALGDSDAQPVVGTALAERDATPLPTPDPTAARVIDTLAVTDARDDAHPEARAESATIDGEDAVAAGEADGNGDTGGDVLIDGAVELSGANAGEALCEAVSEVNVVVEPLLACDELSREEGVAGEAEGDSDADRELDGHADVDNDNLAFTDPDGVRVEDAVDDGQCDTVADTVRDTQVVLVRVATDGDELGVLPAGAQNGPMLIVARCVPAMDSSGEADATVPDDVLDASAVTTVADAEAVGERVADDEKLVLREARTVTTCGGREEFRRTQ